MIELLSLDSPPARLQNMYSTSLTLASGLVNFSKSNRTLNPGLSNSVPFSSTIFYFDINNLNF